MRRAARQVCARSAWQHLSDEEVQLATRAFVGDILQTPPMYSALKKDGVPLYVKARAGEVVERAPRQLHVARFDVWRDEPGSCDFRFAVVRGCERAAGCWARWLTGPSIPGSALPSSQTCSKGTYIRSLAHDLGLALGTHAHLVALRRESIGAHQVATAWPLDALVAHAREQHAVAAAATV